MTDIPVTVLRVFCDERGEHGNLGRDLEITQGRGSRLLTTHEGDGWATVGGRVVADGGRTVVR